MQRPPGEAHRLGTPVAHLRHDHQRENGGTDETRGATVATLRV